MTLKDLKTIGVDPFAISINRPRIFERFCDLIGILESADIPGEIVVDGSFLTEEIEPLDIDSTLCISHDYFESCPGEQLRILEWIRDDFAIKRSYFCEMYLCVEYPTSHLEYFDGIQDRKFWVKLFSESVIYKRKRGLALISL